MTRDQFEELDSEEENTTLKKTIKTFIVPIFVTLFIAFYYPNTALCTTDTSGILGQCWPSWQVSGVLTALVWWTLLGIDKDLKLGSPQIVWTDGHTTTTGRRYQAGDFYIMRAGGIRFRNFEFKGKEGLIIFHKATLNALGMQTAIPVMLKPTPFAKLPKSVRDHIVAYGLLKYKPYRFGLIDPHHYKQKIKPEGELASIKPGRLKELSPTMFTTLYEESNSISNVFEQLNTAALNQLESLKSQISRIGVEEGLWRSIKDKVWNTKTEEE